ncbi:MAG TPA: metallophosphoesterase [Candidatus Acidoferrales bacterium]|nr:metallophosphoesterase [Candidatus Acidoferrales bacterium]
MLRWVALLSLAVFACVLAPIRAASQGEQTWLVLSDIHLDPFDRDEYPARVGSDTNLALFDQSIEQMKHFVPNPSVVLLPGDFLAHGFPGKVHANAPASTTAQVALRTMQRIATSLGKTYPHAQFAIALGNNDASCGDYRTDAGDQYLREVARIWAPLIDRGGSAPDFVRTFSAGGYYAETLPARGLKLVVLNTVPMSMQYLGNCDGPAPGLARDELAWLQRQLAVTPAGVRNIVMMHIPPGYDPVSTQFAHGFLAWSFLKGGYDAALLDRIADPRSQVRYVITGHLHHFDFRWYDRVPILIFGSLSPVYRNNPAFYALRMNGKGAIDDIDTYAYDEWSGDWADGPRSFDAKWNVPRIDLQSLTALHERLGKDPSLRAKWAFGSVAWPSNPDFKWAAWTGRWRIPWCAQVVFGTGYAQCANIENRVTALRAVVVIVALGIAVAVILLARRLRRGPRGGILLP